MAAYRDAHDVLHEPQAMRRPPGGISPGRPQSKAGTAPDTVPAL